MLRVGFLSSQNYLSRVTFSGTLFSQYKALCAQPVKVVPLGWPVKPGLIEKVRRRLPVGGPLDADAPGFARQLAIFHQFVRLQLWRNPCDVLFAPVASQELLGFDCDLPIVYSSDTTFKLLGQTYDLHLSPAQEAQQERMEQNAVNRATGFYYPSRWAADSARDDYGADPAVIDVSPYGANLEHPPGPEVAQRRVAAAGTGICRLLFVGRDFERKGGDIALGTFEQLKAAGLQVQMTMVGTDLPAGRRAPEGLEVITFLNKDDPADAARLQKLYAEAHFMIFPTRADCSPIVLCEAASYGLPVISAEVGGIGDIVSNGEAGVTLSVQAGADAYCAEILRLWKAPALYAAMVNHARQRFDKVLNWEAWGRGLHESLKKAAGA